MFYDFIFIGAGPAGLTGAICAARQGRRCLVLEKKPSLELHPRGETLRHRPIVDKILGTGVMDSLKIASTPLIEYYAPEPDKVEKIAFNMHSSNITFEWNAFMQAFEKQVEPLDIDLVMEAEVFDIIRTSEVVTGVLYKNDKGEEISAKGSTIFACDGHKSVIGQKLGVDYTSMNYPIVKSHLTNATFDTPGLKFFYAPTGALKYAPQFPPALLFLFPRDGKNCEGGIAVMAQSAAAIGFENPSESELLKVWEQTIQHHPVFSKMLKGASVELQETSMIPMTGPMNEVILQKGVVLLGDAAGCVEISGGSGLVSSMEFANFWVNMIIEEQEKPNGSESLWDDETILRMTRSYNSSGVFRHLERNARWSNAHWDTVFVKLRTSEEIIKNWELIRSSLDIY